MTKEKTSKGGINEEKRIKKDLIGKTVKIVYSDGSYNWNWYKIIAYNDVVVKAKESSTDRIFFIPWVHIMAIILGDDL